MKRISESCLIIMFCLIAHKAESMKSVKSQLHNMNEDKVYKKFASDYDCRYLKNLNCTKITPQNAIFAFDLHEVLVKRNFRRIAYRSIWTFCKSFFYTISHPWIIPSMIHVSSEDIAVEGMYVKLTEEYPYLNNYQQDMWEIANGYCRPIDSMLNLLKALKQQGFKIFLLSNLGENSLQNFKQRFDCFNGLFDGFYSPAKSNNYICKPNPKFYECFKQYLESVGCLNKQIIFIDDIEQNIVASTNVGISGIHFQGYDKLCVTLNKLGIALNKK